MAQRYEKPLNNLSYTNKDFGAVYPELLDLAETLSYKWTPIQSDESDPGVVLLKLMAVLADKNNYNIDKNILELFPSSVTQPKNARELFDCLGYSMKHYQAATVDVTLTMLTEPEIDYASLNLDETSKNNAGNERLYTIPQFTMVSTSDNDIVYTIVEEVKLKSNNASTQVAALQGIVTDYMIGNTNIITPDNLDYNNRLYFTDFDVAQNGVFIKSKYFNYSDWIPVDNLAVQALNTPCYKFGVSHDGSRCFIEFPSDISNLVSDGFELKYIRTQGVNGNIGRRQLDQFYGDVTAKVSLANSALVTAPDVVVTASNIFITNYMPSVDGLDPETIEEGQRNYDKIKATFNTLVSLRDYSNYIYTSKMVSNGFVCDRTNDVQSSYAVRSSRDGVVSTSVNVVKKADDSPEMNAVSLKLYGFKFVENPTQSSSKFISSFEVITDFSSEFTGNLSYAELQQIKCLSHDIKSYEKKRVFMLVNKYPIEMKIIPTYKILPTSDEYTALLLKVRQALYETLNSRVIDFGHEINYDSIYDAVVACDNRIKAVFLEDIKYETYAYYIDEHSKPQSVRIDSDYNSSDDNNDELIQQFRKEIFVRCVLAGVTSLYTLDKRFNHKFTNTAPTLITGVSEVEGNSGIHITRLSDSSNVYKTTEPLLSNETVLFTCPHLINDYEYGNYVKYVVKLKSNSIPSSTDYVLTDNEYIILIWRDTEDGDYTYVKYTAGTSINIFTPNFALKIADDSSSIDDKDSKVYYKNITTNGDSLPNFDTLTEGKNTIGNTYTKAIADNVIGSSCVLSGTRTLTTRKINRVTIYDANSTFTHFTWTTNRGTDNECYLFDEGKTEYTLQTGEHVFYGNSTRTMFVELGSGTKIIRKPRTETDSMSLDKWTIKKLNYEDLLRTGIDYLDNYWYRPPSTMIVDAVEQEFVQIGTESTIELTLEGSTALSNNYYIETNTEIKSLNNTGGNWLLGTADSNVWVSGVLYKLSDDTLTRLNTKTHPSIAWTVQPILSLVSSKDSPGYLKNSTTGSTYKSQSLTVYHPVPNLENQHTTLTPNDDTTLYLQSSHNVSTLTNTRANVRVLDVTTGGYSNVDILYYYNNEYDEELLDFDIVPDYAECSIPAKTTSSENTETTYSVSLSPKYVSEFAKALVVIQCVGEHVYFGKSSNTVTINEELNNTTTTSPKEYYYLTVDSSTTISIANNIDKDIVVRVYNPVPYQQPNITWLPTNDFINIVSLIESLDYNDAFNHVGDTIDNPIKDPLKASSFFDSNHPYNKFTIPAWKCDTDDHITIATNVGTR